MKYKLLFISDLHLEDKYPGYLDAQIGCLKRIIREENNLEYRISRLIIGGDVFTNRKPLPSVMLKFKEFLDFCRDSNIRSVFLIRGNHDSENKSDDGITALSLFDRIEQYWKNTFVVQSIIIPEFIFIDKEKIYLIPHYEDENKIISVLRSVPNNCLVFGHFGFCGCIDSIGNSHFTISIDEFRNRTFLGHIHRFNSGDKVTIMGNPYQINFGECRDKKYYGRFTLEEGKEPVFEPVEVAHGIRYISCKLKDLEKYKDDINNPEYYVVLRLLLNKLEDVNIAKIKEDVFQNYFMKHLDIKFEDVVTTQTEISTFNPSRKNFKLDEELISEYLKEQTTVLTKEQLLNGLKKISEYEKS